MRSLFPILLTLGLVMPGLVMPAAAERLRRDPPAEFAEHYVLFLLEVDVLMTDDEWKSFVGLGHDHERDAFVEKFWAERDETPRTPRNEFRDRHRFRLEQARTEFGNLEDPRSRWILLNGSPHKRQEILCADYTWPLDIWFYEALERYEWPLAVVFYRTAGVGQWRVWDPSETGRVLLDDRGRSNAPRSRGDQIAYDAAPLHCNLDVLRRAIEQIAAIQQSGSFVYEKLMDRLQKRQLPKSDEWVHTFESYSTALKTDAEPLPSDLSFTFPRKRGHRTVVRGLLEVPTQSTIAVDLEGTVSYNLVINGEVLREGKLLESFRVRFDLPADEVSELLPLVFERALRPGQYRLILRVEDVHEGRMARHEVDVRVPEVQNPQRVSTGPTHTRKLRRQVPEDLPAGYATWLLEVDVLMTDEERATFLALEKDYQRDAFIERFWRQRDRFADGRNELREEFEERLALARQFGDMNDPRARVLLLNGPAAERVESPCRSVTFPLELWFYQSTRRYPFKFVLVFYQPRGLGKWRLWDPSDGLGELIDLDSQRNAPRSASNSLDHVAILDTIPAHCQREAIRDALKWIERVRDQGTSYEVLMHDLEQPELPASDEWALTFSSYTTDLPEDVRILPSDIAFSFPGWSGGRTLARGLLTIPTDAATAVLLKGFGSYNLIVNGEVLKAGPTGGEELFDSFRLRFDFPADEVGDLLPLVFERYLRPGDYRIVVRVEDLNGPSLSSPYMARHEVDISVPKVDRATVPVDIDPAVRQVLDEAYRAIANGETSLEIQPPIGDLLTGLHRFETLAIGDQIDRITFTLDGRELLAKKNPPYNVEIDLGPFPQTRVLRVTAFDAGGEELASDELLLNASPHRFTVRLVEPVVGKTYRQSLRARADVSLPEGETLERIEFHRGDERLVTLYQEPFTHPVKLDGGLDGGPGGGVTLIRVAAYLTDGTMTEDVVLVNSPAPSEEVDVNFVELYTTVLDRRQRPVLGLSAADFTVYEDGAPQTVQRFERVDNLPIHATILLDISASMEDRLAPARDAALDFFEEIVTPQDRLSAIVFNDRPIVASTFTSRIRHFAKGLAGLKAERGTALYDSLIFSLFYSTGLPGQRAILLLSDGIDESSRFTLDQTVDYLQRSGVTVYSIGLALKSEGRGTLKRFAEETGGRSFFLSDVSGLPEVYRAIREELRTKYLLAYQSASGSDSGSFRRVEVRILTGGLKARTIRGYYP